jgi:REP element-mobilizing transposase RayT
MAWPLRIERPGTRFHYTARGNERKSIFRDDTDRFHFLALLADLGRRFGARFHAFALRDNHFHLLLETPEANLSGAIQWLGVSYTRCVTSSAFLNKAACFLPLGEQKTSVPLRIDSFCPSTSVNLKSKTRKLVP